MPKLLYQDHGSFRLTTNDGRVIFVDPFKGVGYEKPADLILVTHQHGDHNQLDLITKKDSCTVISNFEALAGGKHNNFSILGIFIEAVEAGYNENHSIEDCVGFLVTVDGLQLYFSGDTSTTKQMSTFKERNLDYVFLCGDGFYNMDLVEAAECAKIIGGKHNTPVHMKPGELFDLAMAQSFEAPNRLIIEDGEELELG